MANFGQNWIYLVLFELTCNWNNTKHSLSKRCLEYTSGYVKEWCYWNGKNRLEECMLTGAATYPAETDIKE